MDENSLFPYRRLFSMEEPFLGEVWVGVSGLLAPPSVRLVISLKRSWDTDLHFSPDDARALATGLSGSEVVVVRATTVDQDQALLCAADRRLCVTVMSDRLTEIINLGASALELQGMLRDVATTMEEQHGA